MGWLRKFADCIYCERYKSYSRYKERNLYAKVCMLHGIQYEVGHRGEASLLYRCKVFEYFRHPHQPPHYPHGEYKRVHLERCGTGERACKVYGTDTCHHVAFYGASYPVSVTVHNC